MQRIPRNVANKKLKEENERLKSELMQMHEDNISHLNQQLFNSAISTAYTNNSHAVGDVLSPAYIS